MSTAFESSVVRPSSIPESKPSRMPTWKFPMWAWVVSILGVVLELALFAGATYLLWSFVS